VLQFVLYKALNAPIPLFWHTPILFNTTGKKLSKRDRGFSLEDLKNQGFLPEAINNYLILIGNSFAQEIMTLDEIIKNYNFDNLSTAGQAKYDIEKLVWVNHKWISKYDSKKLTELCRPFLEQAYDLSSVNFEQLHTLIAKIQTDLHTLAESVSALKFYFAYTQISAQDLEEILPQESISLFVDQLKKDAQESTTEDEFVQKCKTHKPASIGSKEYWGALRLAITGSAKGIGFNDLVGILGLQNVKTRIINI